MAWGVSCNYSYFYVICFNTEFQYIPINNGTVIKSGTLLNDGQDATSVVRVYYAVIFRKLISKVPF